MSEPNLTDLSPPARTGEASKGMRPVVPFMRAMLLLGAFLVSLAGIQLYFLTTRTDHYFAWTIKVPLTAAFLGAFYWTAMPLALLSGLERVWVRARVGVPGVLLFLWATLATTVIHAGKFHFHSADRFAKGAAWLWLIIYAADPVLVSIALYLQVRSEGVDPPRTALLPAWYRAAIALQAVVALGVGAALFAAPNWVAGWWPWLLTPLTARAMASWLLGLGGVLAAVVYENDWDRIRLAAVAYTVLGVLQLVALARYSGHAIAGLSLDLYLAFVGTVLILGAFGLWKSRAFWGRRPLANAVAVEGK
jgi:hypothetical protein